LAHVFLFALEDYLVGKLEGFVRERGAVSAIVLLGVLSAAMFSNAFFHVGDIVASGLDAVTYEAPNRAFAYGEMARGTLPFWNPLIMSGTPIFPNFGLFYPPNVLYLLLPVSRAMNVDMALHLFLLGVFAFIWLRGQGRTVGAAFAGGAMLMFSETFFLRTFAGHLTIMAVFAWTPLVFTAIDNIFKRDFFKGAAMGVLAVTMQILTGYIAAVFCVAIASALYCSLYFISIAARSRRIDRGEFLRLVAALAVVGAFPLLTSAAHIFPSIAALREVTRAHGVPYDFASSFSYPWWNLLLLAAPTFFGLAGSTHYWGPEWGYWEVSLSIGIVGLMFAGYGTAKGDKAIRFRMLTLGFALFLIALGKNTPAHEWLFNWAPGFDMLRAPGRFLFIIAMCMTSLAALGIDGAFMSGKRPRIFKGFSFALGLVLLWAAIAIATSAPHAPERGFWAWIVRTILFGLGSVGAPAGFPYLDTARDAVFSLAAGGCCCLVITFFLWVDSRSARKDGEHSSHFNTFAYCGVILLCVFESFVVAFVQRTSTDISSIADPQLTAALASRDKDERVLDGEMNNDRTMAMGLNAIWGYNPVVLRRYAEFIEYSQTGRLAPETKTKPYGGGVNPSFRGLNDMLRMFRCRYLIPPIGVSASPIDGGPALPRFLLVKEFHVAHDASEALNIIGAQSFDAKKTVVLETEPSPAPAPSSSSGSVKLLEETANSMTLNVDAPASSILLISDSYSEGWRARPLESGPQKEYQVLPADYALRGIPLAAGKHTIIVEYIPPGFRAGACVSIASFLIFIGTMVCVSKRMRREENRNQGRVPSCGTSA
jgi:hypothetical protein